MIRQLQIRNFAIIDQLDIDFEHGLTILSGETGAGKSILIDALGLVLGGRADKSAIAEGASQAEINAVIELADDSGAQLWLDEQALQLDDSQELIIRRVISNDGRSRALVNGSPVNLQSLKQLGEMLVEIHGQHAHQLLTRSQTQRTLIDRYGQHEQQLSELGKAFDAVTAAEAAFDTLAEKTRGRDSRLEFLRFQLAELDNLGESLESFPDLLRERDRLMHSDKLGEAARLALDALYDDDSANAQKLLARAQTAVDEFSAIAVEFEEAGTLLAEADASLQEAVDTVRRFTSTLEHEPTRREQLEDKVAAVREAARKHGCEVSELSERRDAFSMEAAELGDAENQLGALDSTRIQAREDYQKVATRLSRARARAAKKFANSVSDAMQTLGMTGGNFAVEIKSDRDQRSRHGIDNIEFLVSANPGRSVQALGRVASGGELSRISLAVQVIAADIAGTPSMVFDEVDAGIGGGVAEIVGQRLRELSSARQVFCVTHLPQVASQGHQHYRVSKMTDATVTRTRLVKLGDSERVDEIARMLGGVEITRKSLEHAREMLESGNTNPAKSA